MDHSLDRAPANMRADKSLMVLPALLGMIALQATARGEDLLDKASHFKISAAPLASALIQFSNQSGVRVAAAAADVADLKSNGVNGTLASGAASAAMSGVTVTAPRPPTDQELAKDGLYQFIVHHATTHYTDTGTARNLARWRGGRQSICPLTAGLSPEGDAFVTARLRAIAAYAGAPVQSDPPQCKSNVQILFTNDPEEEMNGVFKWATAYFRNRYSGGMRNLIKYRSDHAIQGWYMTTSGGERVLNTDVALLRLSVLPVWPQITQNYVGTDNTGSRLGGSSGSDIGIGIVIIVVDTSKVAGYTVGTLADYVAMLTLSVAQSPDHCDPLPSILDLMSSSCRTHEIPTALTASDLAFLKALYYRNTGLGPSLSRDEIEDNMILQFKPR